MDTLEYYRTRAKMFDKCAFYRGTIINQLVLLETLMELLIGDFLGSSKNKSMEIFAVLNINPGIALQTKQNIVGYIAKKYYPIFLKENPNLLKDIQKCIELRNIVAHKKFQPLKEDILNYDGHTIKLVELKTAKGKGTLNVTLFNEEKIKVEVKFIQDQMVKLGALYKKVNPKWDDKIPFA